MIRLTMETIIKNASSMENTITYLKNEVRRLFAIIFSQWSYNKFVLLAKHSQASLQSNENQGSLTRKHRIS